jgi:hypothetical protein
MGISAQHGGAGDGCEQAPRCVPLMARVSWRCRPMSCFRTPRSSGGWPWSGCWPGCRLGAIGSGLTGQGAHRPRRYRHVEVGGVASVCRGDRDRPGRAARCRSVVAGFVGVDGRSGALRRALLRGGPGHRHRRGQATVSWWRARLRMPAWRSLVPLTARWRCSLGGSHCRAAAADGLEGRVPVSGLALLFAG